jgi:ABC-2 type transport system permease protein
VKDSGLTSIAAFGMLLAIFVGAFMIPHEVESRTIYPILAKPVRRYEFLLGKYLGALIILGVIVAILTLVLVAVLLLQARLIGAPEPGQLESQFDPAIGPVVFAAVMSYCSLAVLTALIMLISSVASTTMTVLGAILLWAVGSMQSMIYDLQSKMVGASKFVLWLFYHVVPPLQNFDFRSNVANGTLIDVPAAIGALGSGLLYIVVALLFASLFFENRQV